MRPLAGFYGWCILRGVVGDYMGATIAVTEVAIYLALAANWEVLSTWEAKQGLLTLAAVVAIPIIYSRKIVDFNHSC